MTTKNVQVSIVMPCLNEEETLGICIQKAQRTLDALGIVGEVVIADNGSTDASAEIAERLGASVVHQPTRGYGAAYLAGLAAAQGQYIIMGDSDDTYDFTDLERLITPLQNGYDLVIGNRFKGKILPGQCRGQDVISGTRSCQECFVSFSARTYQIHTAGCAHSPQRHTNGWI